MFIRFSRYRFKEGKEAEGLEIVRALVRSIAVSEGCEQAWVAQGQHPSTEVVVIALFRGGASLRRLEGRLRSDPGLGGDIFPLMRLTTRRPEVTQYEVVPDAQS